MTSKRFIYALLENIFFNALVFFIFYFFAINKDGFLSLNIHPLLIVVVMMSLRYGNYLGVFSAILASFHYFGIYLLLDRDLVIFFTDISYYKFLVIFFAFAVVLGRFKDNYDYDLLVIRDELDLLHNANDELKKAYHDARFIKNELKKQIVGAEYSILSLYEIASALDTLDSEEVYTETMGILSMFLRAKTISIYSLSKAKPVMRLKIRMGEGIKLPQSIFLEDYPQFDEVVRDKQIVKRTAAHPGNFPLLCAPLIDDGEVIAVLNIEDMDFEYITDYSFNVFKVITEWVNKALVQAIEIEERYESTQYITGTKVMHLSAFAIRLTKEKKRFKRFGIHFGLLMYKAEGIDLTLLNEKLSDLLRDVDVMGYNSDFDYKNESDLSMDTVNERVSLSVEVYKSKKDLKGDVFILLPATPDAVLNKIDERIRSAFDYKLERVNYE